MKNFKYFSPLLFLLLFSTIELSAYTTTICNNLVAENVTNAAPFSSNDINALLTIENVNFSFEELQATASSSSSFIQNNLNILYALCLALVLFNLVAQIKIIIQMIHLFFLFRKKDDAVRLNF